MNAHHALHHYLAESTRRFPENRAVEEPDGSFLTYRELDSLSDRVRDRLAALGVRRGDRVGICVRKSIDAVAAIFGILKAGGAYVPVDYSAPAARNAFIFDDCAVKTLVIEEERLEPWKAEASGSPELIVLNTVGGGAGMQASLDALDGESPAPAFQTIDVAADDLAYILYTSGSTGKPKGVMLTHRNGTSFIDWCSETFRPDSNDRFSSHAPFHFDLSILDIYLSLKHGAALVLISEDLGKSPGLLAPFIAEKQISVWYSTPSILTMLVQYGKMESHNYSALHTVFFAGEVFPVKHLRNLKALLSAPRYYNLYGPTETNVCTWFEIPGVVEANRSEPYPIGQPCSHIQTRVLGPENAPVSAGTEGELLVRGAGVTQGYWNLEERTEAAFVTDADGRRWYRTGDIVIEDAAGDYLFVGRRDRMVKKRGYRVELGEIEAGLYRHPDVEEAAVVAHQDPENGVRIRAFLTGRDGKRPSLINLKGFCTKNLPSYMAPDAFTILDVLPKTSTDKIDYQTLKTMQVQ